LLLIIQGVILPTPPRQGEAAATNTESSANNAPGILGQFHNERCCIRCEEASCPELGNVLRCRGCLNGYHPACLNPEEPPSAAAAAEEKWRCQDCLSGVHPCFICKLSEGEIIPTVEVQLSLLYLAFISSWEVDRYLHFR
jgi:hypothetical protein